MIYIGNFLHTTNQEQKEAMDRRHGEFTLIVETNDAETALHLFREKILAYRRVRDFFPGECTIFLAQFYELATFPKKEAILLNYNSYAGDPVMPFIGCTLPSAVSDECRIYEWNENEPQIDGIRGKPFVEFKSQVFREKHSCSRECPVCDHALPYDAEFSLRRLLGSPPPIH